MKLTTGLMMGLVACTGCTPDTVPAASGDVIEISTGGFFSGITTVQIFGDDHIVRRGPGRAGDLPNAPETQRAPGGFARAAAVLASRGQTLRFALRSASAPCPDYGSDLVTATPPIAGIAALSSSCPNRALTNLISDLETAMALPK